jgi:tetraacyldisaccharide 4'-kinase
MELDWQFRWTWVATFLLVRPERDPVQFSAPPLKYIIDTPSDYVDPSLFRISSVYLFEFPRMAKGMTWKASEFRELVSGERRGAWASVLRLGLRMVEGPYTLAVRLRNQGYDFGALPINGVEIPVISVGNLTMGGTGKTPIVAWLARWLADRRVRVGIVSRGYGAKRGEKNDEALVLTQQLPQVRQVQNPDRRAGAQDAWEKDGCEVILLDDGFQHRRLARDLDIVLIDAQNPFGYGHVFPRGMLREPIDSLRRANVIALSRSDMVEQGERETIRRQCEVYAPHAAWCEWIHQPKALINASNATETLATLSGQRVAGFCGIGNPAGFLHTLRSSSCQVVGFREFPDHCRYAPEQLEAIGQWAAKHRADALVCTQKDLVKIRSARLGGVPLWAVTIEAGIVSGAEALESRLETLLIRRGFASKAR